MSILLADTPTSQPAHLQPVTPVIDPGLGTTILWVCLIWAVLAILTAFLFGAFRKRSICGPEHYGPIDSGWDFLMVLLIGFMAGIAAGAPLIKIFHFTAEQKQLELLVLNAGIAAVTFASILFVLKVFRPGSLKQIGLDPKRISMGVVGGGVTLFILYPLIQLTGAVVEFIYTHYHLKPASPHEVLLFLDKTTNPWLTALAISVAVVIAPFTEELMYRGLLQTALGKLFTWLANEPKDLSIPRKAWPKWAAVLVASALFAAVHIEPAFLAPIFVLAVGLGYVYERTGNLWINIIAHALFNAAQILIYRVGMH